MASKVSIINYALSKLGSLAITTLTEATKERRAATNVYNEVRDKLIAAYPWNFAIKRISLPQLSTIPDFEFDYEYQLPADCLRPLKLYDTTEEYKVEAGKILTDAANSDNEIDLIYIARIEDEAQFSPSFVECFAIKLAAEIAPRLKEDPKLRLGLIEEFIKVALPEAYFLNAIEGDRPLEKGEQPLDEGNYTWQKTGR